MVLLLVAFVCICSVLFPERKKMLLSTVKRKLDEQNTILLPPKPNRFLRRSASHAKRYKINKLVCCGFIVNSLLFANNGEICKRVEAMV